MPNHPSRTFLLLQERLGSDLDEYARARRLDDGWSWNRVALDLRDRTEIVVTQETLRLWFPELRERGRTPKRVA